MGEEVLQAVGAHGVLTLLLDLVVMDGEKLGRDRAVQYVPEGRGQDLVLGVGGNVPQVRTDLGLGQAQIYVVHAGMVAVIGAPAVDELAEVLGAHIQAVDLVGDVHEHLGALSGLGVFKGDAVIVMGVADVVKMLVDGLADINDPDLRAALLGHDDGVGLGAGGSAEAGQGAGHHVRGGQAHALHGHGADHDGQGGVGTAGDAHYAVVKPGVLHALHKAGNLNVQHTAAVVRKLRRVGRQMGMHPVDPAELRLLLLRAEVDQLVGAVAQVKAAGGPAQVHHVLHVKLGDDKAVLLFGPGQNGAVFGGHAEAGEHIVRAALALAGGRHEHAAFEAAGQGADAQLCLVGRGDSLREGGHLGNEGGSRLGVEGGGRDHRIHIRAQLHTDGEPGQHGAVKENVRPQRHGHAAQRQLGSIVLGRGEGTAGNILPGHQSQKRSVVYGGTAV